MIGATWRRWTVGANGRPALAALFVRNRLAAFGLAIVATFVVLALATPILPLPDPDLTDLANRLKPPLSVDAPLGTDHLGRDMLARLMWGTRVSLAVGLVATLVAALVGSTIGIVAGYRGGRVDNVMMRGIDMLMAFPYMLLALAIVAVLGPGLLNALFAIAIVNIPFFARNVRGVTLGIAAQEFVAAGRMSGLGPVRILYSELLPNVMPVIVITMSTTVGWMILETAGLSFLGLGAQPPQADLGSMLGDGRKLIIVAPHVATIPGLVIFVLVMGINLFGDGIRDVLDPRLRSGALTRPSAATAVARDRRLPEPAPDRADTVLDEAVLDVRGLRTGFHIGGEIYRAVEDVDFVVHAGECLGIVGESGSGKSVTALSLARLVATPPGRIDGGRILFRGTDLVDAPLDELRAVRGEDIAYVFQDPQTTLHPLFPIGEQLAEAIRVHHDLPAAAARARAISLLDKVGIANPSERARAYPHQLSGGMRQRVGIAMALANRPELIIADEPTTALDVTIQAQVLRLLDDLRREEGSALLFITHDFGVVSTICDRVLVMYAGRIVEAGATDALLTDPRHPYTRRLIDCVPRLGDAAQAIDAIPGLPPAANRLPRGCAFAERCDRRTAACEVDEIPLRPIGGARAVRCLHPVAADTR